MPNYNKVIIIGHLTRDPEVKYLPSQTAVAEFGVAVNHKWKGSDGQPKEEVCFVDVRAYGKPAEAIGKYLSKGKAVLVEGRLQLDQWEAKDGTKRSKHRIALERFAFMGPVDKSAETQQPAPPPSQDAPPADDNEIPF